MGQPPQYHSVRSADVARITLTVVATLAAVWFLWQIKSVLVLFGLAAFIACALGPIVEQILRVRLPLIGHLPRAAAVIVTYLAFLAAATACGLLLVPHLIDGVRQLTDQVPGMLDRLRESAWFADYDDRYNITDKLSKAAEQLPGRVASSLDLLSGLATGVVSAVAGAVTVGVISIYLLIDGKRLVGRGLLLVPLIHQPRAKRILYGAYHAVAGYALGMCAIALLGATFTALVLLALGVGHVLPLAVLMFLLCFIPLVGSAVAAVIVGAVCAFSSTTDAVIWGAAFILYQQLENHLLQPLIHRRTVNLHPLLVIGAVLVGATRGGVVGALVAIPVVAILQIALREWWSARMQRAALAPAQEAPPAEIVTGVDLAPEPPVDGAVDATHRLAEPDDDAALPPASR